MPGELWYPVYNNVSKDVVCAGFFTYPESYDPGVGNSLGVGQQGSIPNPLLDRETSAALYTYNTVTNLVEHK